MQAHTKRPRRIYLKLTAEDYEFLRQLSLEPERGAKRAKFILALAHGMNVTDASRLAGFSRPVAYRWLERVEKLGIQLGLSDKPYELHERSPAAVSWVNSLATRFNGAPGFDTEKWTYDSLARYIRAFAIRQGHPELARITTGGVHKMLESSGVSLIC